MKAGYHHVDIFPDHRKYLVFSWDFGTSVDRYFQFTVLPFRLSSAPFNFTKLLKPLEAHWRGQGIPIALFFDDGIGAGSSMNSAKINSSIVRILHAVASKLTKKSLVGSPRENFLGLAMILTLKRGLYLQVQ